MLYPLSYGGPGRLRGYQPGGGTVRCGVRVRAGTGRTALQPDPVSPVALQRVTPADLADAVRAALEGAVDRRSLARPGTRRVVIERPRNREHGDYATNIAHAAGQAGRPAAAGGRGAARRAAPGSRGGRARSTSPAPDSSTSPSRRRRSGELARTDRRGRGRPTAETSALAGQQLNLEFVSANPTGPVHIGGTPAGPPSATRWAGCCRPGRDRHAGVLLQRRRRPDRPLRRVAVCRARRPAGAGGRLPGRLHRCEIAAQVRRQPTRSALGAARGGGTGGVPARGRRS